MRLPGQLVRSQMIGFAMGHGCGLMGVSRLVVKFRGAVVWALGIVLSSLCWMQFRGERSHPRYRPIHPPSTVRMAPVT